MSLRPTEEQQRIVDIDEGCHLVVAPPGSGKTAILSWRAARLLRSEPDATWRILALTFTTKAAQNLSSRIEGQLDDRRIDLPNRVRASTIHAFCFDVLQHYGDLVAFPSPTSVYDETDREAAVVRALREAGLPSRTDAGIRALLYEISRAKREMLGPEALSDPQDSVAFAAYDRIMAQLGACDYDDLLRFTWRLFTDQPKVARHYRRMFRYVVVDEAQDMSKAQYLVLDALCRGERKNLMLVADDRQAIYGFNGGSVEFLAKFEKDFGATRHALRGNFRCASEVVAVANRLAQAMSDNRPTAMVSAGRATGRVVLEHAENEAREAFTVADWIQNLLVEGLSSDILESDENGRIAEEDIAVLGRSRRQLQSVRSCLVSRGVPVLFNDGGRAAYQHPLVQLVVSGLRIAQNPRDIVTRSRLMATWDTTDEVWLDLGSREGPEAAIAKSLSALATDADPTHALDEAVRILGASTSVSAEDEGEELQSEIDGLREIVERWKGKTAGNHRTLGSFLADLAVAGRPQLDRPGVRVLTIHAAKGLEFKAVAIVGWDQGSIPDFRAKTEDQIKEERRSAYVAITRAARSVLLTWPKSRDTRYGARAQKPSLFLAEMGFDTRSL